VCIPMAIRVPNVIGPESRPPGDDVTADAHIRRTSARATRPPLAVIHSTYVSHTCYFTVYTRHASTHMMSHSIHTHAHRETRAHMRHISHGAPAMPLPRVGCGLCTWSTWEASSTPPLTKLTKLTKLGGKFHTAATQTAAACWLAEDSTRTHSTSRR